MSRCPDVLSDLVTDHLVALPGSTWALWRTVILRGAGFPARGVLALASTETVRAAERVFELEEAVAGLYRDALQVVDRALDTLRESGRWDDNDRRRPLMKALYAFGKGKVSKRSDLPPEIVAAGAEIERAEAELDTARTAFGERYDRAVAAASATLAEVAADERFREAVTWQNRHALLTALDPLVRRGDDSRRNSQRRQHEEAVAGYLQRYSVKNDTVGFFGPVGWARFSDDEAVEPVRVEAGEPLLEHRAVYFENWCIDALARTLGGEPALKPWLAPRLRPLYHLEGDVLFPPFGKPYELGPEEARILAACDGERTACEIAAELLDDPELVVVSEEQVFELIETWRRRRVLVWSLEAPLELYPERSLRRQLERIGDPGLRERLLGKLDELLDARTRVQSAAGDAARLERAMAELEATFSRLTGQRPRRNEGQTYAARGLVYEDCRRSARVELGPEVLEGLGSSLGIVLLGARWLAGELSRRVEAEMLELHDELGGGEVASYLLLSKVLDRIFLRREPHPLFAELEAELQARWARVLGIDGERAERIVAHDARSLVSRAEREFGTPHPAWTLAGYVSPDLMIAADGPEALERGDFELVLGEVHVSNCLGWSCFLSQHPHPEELLECVRRDAGSQHDGEGVSVLLPQGPKQSWTQRMAISLVLPEFYRYYFGDDPPGDPPCRPLPAGAVVIERGADGLVARTRDGSGRFRALDLLGIHLTQSVNDLLGTYLPEARHQPRITVDRLVLQRERWSFAAAELEIGLESDGSERFLSVVRWAQSHGLPRFCFYKVSWERKPLYVDFASPIYVDLFAKTLRAEESAGGRVSISEMLPRVDQTWLTDADGELYTSELRMAAHDLALAEDV